MTITIIIKHCCTLDIIVVVIVSSSRSIFASVQGKPAS